MALVHRTDDGKWMWWCAPCGTHHWGDGERWTFDGNVDCPTFSPSFLVQGCTGPGSVCHSYVKNGQIQYLNDCTHALRGKTVPLTECVAHGEDQ